MPAGDERTDLPPWARLDPAARLLPEAFFARPAEQVAPDLLGKIVVSRVGGVFTGGRIVETEAYLGSHDPGSHAATRGITKRNAVMYGPPGRTYVYFTYGNHHMLNLVSEPEGTAGGVLLRAIEPTIGAEEMLRRRGRPADELANGPGKLAQALGVDLSDNGSVLGLGRLAVFDAPPPDEPIEVSGRVGLSAGHELDLRFYLKGNPAVSRGRTGPLKPPGRKSRSR